MTENANGRPIVNVVVSAIEQKATSNVTQEMDTSRLNRPINLRDLACGGFNRGEEDTDEAVGAGNTHRLSSRGADIVESLLRGADASLECDPVKLNLRNLFRKWYSPHDAQLGGDHYAERLDSFADECPSSVEMSTPLSLYRRRREVCLLYDPFDEELRCDERHPLLPLQVALFREWCLLNLIDAFDVSGTFNAA